MYNTFLVYIHLLPYFCAINIIKSLRTFKPLKFATQKQVSNSYHSPKMEQKS